MTNMKKFLLAILVAAAPVAVFSSCSDDDKDTDAVLSEVAAGDYSGTYKAGILAEGSMDVKISKIVAETRATEGGGSTAPVYEGDLVDIQIGSLQIEALGTITFSKIEGVNLKGKKGNVSIPAQTVKTMIGGLSSDAFEAELTLSGSVVKESSLTLKAASFKAENAPEGVATVLPALIVDIQATKK